MNNLKIAVIGSGLSALGSLAALRDIALDSNVTIFSHAPISNLKTRHKIIYHKDDNKYKYGIHLVKTILNNRNNYNNTLEPLIRSINYNCFGGSSVVWGGACHPLLDNEACRFNVDIKKGYEAISKLFGCDDKFTRHVSTPVSINSEIEFTKTLTLGHHINPNKYKVNVITTEMINKMGSIVYGEVMDIKDNSKNVLLKYKSENGEIYSEHYDYIILASGVVGTTKLLASYLDENVTLTHATNEQYLFFARYNTSFNKNIFGPPSLLINRIMGFPGYVQLYPINMLATINKENLFSTSKDANKIGILAGYLYIDSRASFRLQTQSFRGSSCNASILDSVEKSIFERKDFIEKMNKVNIKIIGNPIKLYPTSSQHIGASLNNLYNFKHRTSSRILISDTNAMPLVPLCTIGLTSAANSYATTKNFFI